MAHAKARQIIHHNKVCGVSLTEQAHGQAVMLNRVYASCPQHIKQVIAKLQGPNDQSIDVANYKLIRMLVIGAECDMLRMRAQESVQGFEIPGGAALADPDLHSRCTLVERLFR